MKNGGCEQRVFYLDQQQTERERGLRTRRTMYRTLHLHNYTKAPIIFMLLTVKDPLFRFKGLSSEMID